MDQNKTLIFIPDISGYTNFVNHTESSHQKHILTELLEMLIDENDLDLELAEVEGDALFFYKQGKLPDFESIWSQVQKMFVRFHSHLRYYDKYRLCHCGACSGATGLNLKFIVHIGEVDFLQIKDRPKKPHGKNVILAHRLMKNEIESNEYVLITQDTLDQLEENEFRQATGFEFTDCVTDYGARDIGEVKYCFTDLGDLKSKVSEPEQIIMENKVTKPIKIKRKVSAEPLDIFELLLNFEYRKEWTQGLQGIEYNQNEMNKVGSKHVCIIDNKKIEIETVTSDFGDDTWLYGEKSKAPFIKELLIYYIIKPLEKGSELLVEIHPKPVPVLGDLFIMLFRGRFKKIISKSIDELKKLAESGRYSTKNNNQLAGVSS